MKQSVTTKESLVEIRHHPAICTVQLKGDACFQFPGFCHPDLTRSSYVGGISLVVDPVNGCVHGAEGFTV